jgi:hypothetical protein
MARSSVTITQAEEAAYNKFAKDNRIINDNSAEGNANGVLVENYFLQTWNADITEANLAAALEQLRPHLKFYSENDAKFAELYTALSSVEKEEFNNWKATAGIKPTTYNGAVLLIYLTSRKYPVTGANLTLAASQNKVAPLLEWEEFRQAPLKGRVDRKDDGEPFLGRNVNQSALDKNRELRAAQEKNNPTAAPASTSSVQAAAKAQAESLRGNTHSETEMIQKVFATNGTEIDWVQTVASREAFQRRLNNQQAVRRFIR